jgi:thiamine-monophosphate kinase
VASSPPLGEFERIARFFAPLAAPGALDLRDDAALIDGPRGMQYVVTADSIAEGVHFFANDPPAQVAQKLLRVNLSDLAAKGAEPVGYLLTTALPASCDEDWLAAFAKGLAADQKNFGIGLLGGDSVAVQGPAVLSVTAIGRVKSGRAVLRRGARPGNIVYVSGTLGDGALGLQALKGRLGGIDRKSLDFLIGRYRLPEPRLALGRKLAGIALAMADISDGLIADLGHICEASNLGATIEAAALPLSPAARSAIEAAPQRIAAPLSGGDDYELVFAAPRKAAHAIAALARRLGVPLTPIGRFEKEAGVRVLDVAGQQLALPRQGYRHF